MKWKIQHPGGQRPVFVDPSGRRQRRLRRAGAFGVVLAVGYVFLLLSTALVGPTIHSPFLPLAAVRPAAVAGASARLPTASPGVRPDLMLTSDTTPDPARLPVAEVALSMSAVTSTSSHRAASTLTSAPTSTASPVAAAKVRGKSTSVPTPTTRPTKTAR